MLRRGNRFDELVERQLELFAVDEPDLLAEADAAEDAWNRAPRDEAEEAYGDYQLSVDAIADRLLEIRDGYATTLEESATDTYRSAFNRLAARRFRRHPTIASDLES
jgi:hypothetical protein